MDGNGVGVRESINLAILLSSSTEQCRFAQILASVSTLSEYKVTWSYVSGVFVKEENRSNVMTETSIHRLDRIKWCKLWP